MPTHNRFINGPDGKPSPQGLVILGAFFPIEVQVPPQIAELLTNNGQSVPAPISGLAMIDTGATMTCVHEPLLQQLGLKPISVVTSGTANGPAQQSVYGGRIFFPAQGWTLDLNGIVGVNLGGQIIPVPPAPQPLIALLGRNFLEHFVFIWNGPGGFWTISGR